MKMKLRRRITVAAVAAVLGLGSITFSVFGATTDASVHMKAMSTQSKSAKAVKLYQKKAKTLSKNSTYVIYKCKDITGDGVPEMFVENHPGTLGSGRYFRIYTYNKGKLKCILKTTEYGLSRVKVYRKTNAIVMYCAGHGGENYTFFKKKNGKYRELASKAREAEAGGSMQNGPLYYSSQDGELSKTQFRRIVGGMEKGKKQSLNIDNWKEV